MLTNDFTAYAAKIGVTLKNPASADSIKKQLISFLSLVASECSDQGAYLIGHIKCIAESKEGFYASSITAPTDAPMIKGEMEDGSLSFDIIVNVLLYGLDKLTVKQITKAAVPAVFADCEYKAWDLEEESNHIHLSELFSFFSGFLNCFLFDWGFFLSSCFSIFFRFANRLLFSSFLSCGGLCAFFLSS